MAPAIRDGDPAEPRAAQEQHRDDLIQKRAPGFDAIAGLLGQVREQVQVGLALSGQIAALDAALGEQPHQPLFAGHQHDDAEHFALAVAGMARAVLAGVLGEAVNLRADPLPADAPIAFDTATTRR